jgi:predicted 3-demethylubiquinone-9 3-methyltransferase (glyoxalase superfamily)
MQKIVVHLWYDQEAMAAANFYTSLFERAYILNSTTISDTPSGDAQMVTIDLEGQQFMLISAGPLFKFTPSISLRVDCSTEIEAQNLWKQLSDGGDILMPLMAYDFSPCYGWLMDRYGLSWQIMTTPSQLIEQKITPTLMFTANQCGKAEEAITYYTSLLPDSAILDLLRYSEDEAPNEAGTIKYMAFKLVGQNFAAMDSAYMHEFTFNEAISLIINCDNQSEIDRLWEALSAVPEAEACGWLKDRYGLSWQIIPTIMNQMMGSGDPEKLNRVTKAFLKMKKFDITTLERAFNGN